MVERKGDFKSSWDHFLYQTIHYRGSANYNNR